MTSPSQSQLNNGDITCSRCGTNNSAKNAFCTSCAAPLGPENTTIGNTQTSSSETSNVIIGALTLGVAAYGLWKLLHKSGPEPQSQANEVPPPSQREKSAPRKQTLPTRKPHRPHPAPDEHVDGMVEGMIRIYSSPGRSGGEIEEFEVNTMPPFYVGSVPIYPPHKVRYSSPVPPKFVFFFVIDNYPSGPVTEDEWNSWTGADADILWISQEFVDKRGSANDILAETPDYRRIIDDFLQRAIKAEWTRAGHGKYWFSYRLRTRYDKVGPLKWK